MLHGSVALAVILSLLGSETPRAQASALDKLVDFAAGRRAGFEPAARARVVRQVVAAYFAKRGADPDFVARVDAICGKHRWNGKRALRKDTDVLRTLSVLIDTRRARLMPPDKVVAHPASRVFPGAVPDRAPRIERSFVVDTSVPRWHGTGLYVAPGEVAELLVEKLPSGARLDVVVGCHTDSIQRRPRWRRFPKISRRYRITAAGSHRVANAFGGLLYVACNKTDAGKIRVVVKGAVAAPRFVLGKTSREEWRRQRALEAPFGELECDRLILSMPRRVLGTIDDPAPIMKFWSDVVRVQDELAHHDRESPERFVFDRQISNGYMHSGYPLMGPVSAAPKAVDLAALRAKGSWGMFHEIGHNHQTVHFHRYANPWTFDKNVEVTVNIFASYTYVAALRRPKAMGHQHWRTDILAESLKAGFGAGAYGKRSHKSRCLFWVWLIEEFGWDTLRGVFGTYARMPQASWPRSDIAKRSLLLEVYSKAVGHDLGPAFAAWGLETTAEARAAAAKLPAYRPRVRLPVD